MHGPEVPVASFPQHVSAYPLRNVLIGPSSAAVASHIYAEDPGGLMPAVIPRAVRQQ
jgi:hypothetical protein